MNSLIVQLILLLGLVAVQVSLWPSITTKIMPAFILAAAFAVGFSERLAAGFRIAFVGGLLLDLYAQAHFGRFTIAATLAYGVTMLLLRGQSQELSLGLRATLALTGALVYELVVLIFIRAGSSDFPFFAQLLQVATLNVLGTVAAYLVFSGLLNLQLGRPNQRSYGPRPLSE